MNTEFALNQLSKALNFIGTNLLDRKAMEKEEMEQCGCLLLVLSEYANILDRKQKEEEV